MASRVLAEKNMNKKMQVVRADMKELWDLDLHGAPYAYTPFCSSREETLGYQFWRGGFWQTHLRGKPYHISALYVVDLNVFRRTAVGDTVSIFCDTPCWAGGGRGSEEVYAWGGVGGEGQLVSHDHHMASDPASNPHLTETGLVHSMC